MKHAVSDELKRTIQQTGLNMVRDGMTIGTWGNFSIRDFETGYIYISPSGMDYASIQPQHVVVMTTEIEIIDGEAEPSVEKHMHAEVYKARTDVGAVIHTHPVYSSVFGAVWMDLPAVSEDFAQIVGSEARCCPNYRLPGTVELGLEAVATLGEYNAVILPNHGALSVGPDMRTALKVSLVLEKNAQIYLLAKLLGTPRLFEQKDIDTMQQFARQHYGKKNLGLG